MKKMILSVTAFAIIATSALAGCMTVVRTAPPPARVELRPAPPFHGAVWIGGHWTHRHSRWAWSSGYWKKSPKPGAVWAPDQWKKTRRGWKRTRGHWRY
ncbi:MAG: hypothetical protein L0922_07070 [Candidatus Mariimomonas ferrooxydans]